MKHWDLVGVFVFGNLLGFLLGITGNWLGIAVEIGTVGFLWWSLELRDKKIKSEEEVKTDG